MRVSVCALARVSARAHRRAVVSRQNGAMELIVWIVTGAAVGWLSYARLGFNGERGPNVSLILGAVGAVLGVKLVGPLFVAVPATELTVAGLFFAAGAAAAVLALGDLVYSRWGV